MAVILIKGARAMDPATGLDAQSDVLVSGGVIARMGETIGLDRAVRALSRAGTPQSLVVIDAEDLWLWPGLIDPHVHLREPGFTDKETVRTGTLAAAAGGYTTVVCEPNTDPPVDSLDLVKQLAGICEHDACVNVYFKAAMTQGRRGLVATDVRALAEHERVVALSDDGDPVVSPQVMADVCRAAARADLLLSPHCEDSPRSVEALAAGADPGFEPAEPYANEHNYVERDVSLAIEHGCRIHVSHVSQAQSVAAIDRLRASASEPSRITFEVTPHHLLLSSEDFQDAPAPTVNPPIRSAADRDAVLAALRAGAADAMATDHAPHTAEDKAAGASGLIGMETSLGLVLTRLVEPGLISPLDAARLMSLQPARIFRLPGGHLQRDTAADLVLIDPRLAWAVEADQFRSKARNTPFGGWWLRGRAVATFVGGEQVYAHPCMRERERGPAEDDDEGLR